MRKTLILPTVMLLLWPVVASAGEHHHNDHHPPPATGPGSAQWAHYAKHNPNEGVINVPGKGAPYIPPPVTGTLHSPGMQTSQYNRDVKYGMPAFPANHNIPTQPTNCNHC